MSEPSGDVPAPNPDHAISDRPVSLAAITADLSKPAGPRGWILISWMAIVIVIGVLQYLQYTAKRGDRTVDPHEGAHLVVLEINMRVQIGVASTLAAGNDAERAKLAAKVADFNRGSVDQRMMAAICLGELLGPKVAKTSLEELNAELKRRDVTLKPNERRHLDNLITLYGDYVDNRPDAPMLAPVDHADILKSFGWFGELALGPPIGPPNQNREAALSAARSTMVVLFAAAFAIIGVFLLGLGVLGMILIAWYRGRWRRHLAPAVPYHGVYVETFALWLILYFAILSFGLPLLQRVVPDAIASCLAMALSLIALAWPVFRGIRWKQVRKDIGWTLGSAPLLEPTFGFLSYFASVPLLAIAAIWVMLYNKFTAIAPAPPTNPFEPDPSMAHPIIQKLSQGSLADWLPLFLLACVIAPIVEETFFRGVLYRHVRDALRAWTFGFFFSVVVVSVVFAIVHPQGLIAAPLLASLAAGFALAREWRDTLIPGIIAHGFNNTLVLAFAGLCLMR